MSEKEGVTLIITLDQQLYYITFKVTEDPWSWLRFIVQLLWGWHTNMTQVDAIRCIVARSGMKDILAQVFAVGT